MSAFAGDGGMEPGTQRVRVYAFAFDALTRVQAPMQPHVCEELWKRMGHDGLASQTDWPRHDPAMLIEDTVEYPVQVNGKLRGKVTVPSDADDAAIEAAARADENVAAHMEGKTVRKVIVIKGRLINIVVG